LRWARSIYSKPENNEYGIDPSHKGPITVYMAKVADATGPVPEQGWFKIFHDGFTAEDGKWAIDRMNANEGLVTVKIPECLPDGDYLLRGEVIALHQASTEGGAGK